MKKQRKIREEVLKMLFSQEFHTKPSKYLKKNKTSDDLDSQTIHHIIQIIEGIKNKKIEIDQMIQQTSHSWELHRMPLMDLNIMRIAIYEMLYYEPRVPVKVCINEALEIAKIYGSADSHSFINGILDPIAKKAVTISN